MGSDTTRCRGRGELTQGRDVAPAQAGGTLRPRGRRRRFPLAVVLAMAASLACFAAGLAAFCQVQGATVNTSVFALDAPGVTRAQAGGLQAANARAASPLPFIAWLADDGAAEGGSGSGSESEGESGSTEGGGSAAPLTRVVTARVDDEGFPVTEQDVSLWVGLPCARVNHRLLALSAHGSLFLYPLLLAGWLAAHCLRAAARPQAGWASQALLLALPVATALAATASLTATLRAFGEFFPTRWSDFPAWGGAAQKALADAAQLMGASGAADAALVREAVFAVACAAAACLLLAAGLALLARWTARTRPRHGRRPGAACRPSDTKSARHTAADSGRPAGVTSGRHSAGVSAPDGQRATPTTHRATDKDRRAAGNG